MTKVLPPYLGAAYYPEAWPMEEVDKDIKRMKEAGMNVMRVAEFAWKRMEPWEGEYDFAWLHTVVDKLEKAGIAVIMCTPTCTPPAWLSGKHPEILVVNDQGVRSQHGARRHACPNSPVYREHVKSIVTHMAEEFGQNDNIIGWQIDNEMYPWGRGCCCPVCREKFIESLKKQFGTIEELNRTWGLQLWSQGYSSFDEIPIPRSDTWHNPSLQIAWMTFQSDSYIECTEVQADILHKLTKHPIGTDMMPFGGLNYNKIHKKLDLVQFNHYNTMDDLWKAGFWMDFIRTVKDVPFWNTETQTNWNGSVSVNDGYKAPGFCRVNSWLPVALGGEANLYWLWRAHWSGHELMHGSVVSSSGRPLHIIDEVRQISDGFGKASAFLNSTRPANTGLAMHLSGYAWWFYEFQPVMQGFRYTDYLMDHFYHPLIKSQFRPDIIDPAASLDNYRLVISPFFPALDESGLREKLKKWIEEGGTWVVGPLSDIRTLHATKYVDSPYGCLEEWAGFYSKYEIPNFREGFAAKYNDGTDFKGSAWFDGMELRGAEALAEYTEGPLKGLAAVIRKKMGKGQIIVLGTIPSPEDLIKLLSMLEADSGVAAVAQATGNLLVVPRTGAGGQGMVVVEMENRAGKMTLLGEMTDLLTGNLFSGEIDVEPYTVMVLKK